MVNYSQLVDRGTHLTTSREVRPMNGPVNSNCIITNFKVVIVRHVSRSL